jgi:protocatechuate 3,4-dioxygenase, beta subunit
MSLFDLYATRRAVALGGLSLAAGGAAVAQQVKARPDLYNGEGADQLLARVPKQLVWRSRIPNPSERGEPMLLQGRTLSWQTGEPVAGVIVHAYHTNSVGVYEWSGGKQDAGRQIIMQGWAKTGADGRYAFDTVKPGIYPSRDSPTHVHMNVIEPGRRPYWIDEVVFEGEYGVTSAYRAAQGERGGSGTVRLTREASGTLQATRDIRLERHPA